MVLDASLHSCKRNASFISRHAHKQTKKALAIAISLILAPSVVMADCGENIGSATSTVSCTPASGDASLSANGMNIVISAAGPAIEAKSITGNVAVQVSDSQIETSGSGGIGVWATSVNGDATVANRGNITTQGVDAHAIYVDALNRIQVDNYGSLESFGDDSKGLAVNSGGSSNGDITVNHHSGASIVTHGGNTGGAYRIGSGSSGIFVGRGVNTVGNITVNIDGDVMTYGDNRAAGVFIKNAGVGDVTVNATGNILSASTSGPYSYGIAASIGDNTSSASQGNVGVYYTNANGIVETRAENSSALYAYIDGRASGNVSVENAGLLKTTGDGLSYGIWARVLSGDGSATVVNSGNIITDGDLAASFSPMGIRADTLTGGISVANSGTIATVGEAASGIYTVTNAGSVQIANEGTIVTKGEGAIGIESLVKTTDGQITTAHNSGTIQTSGEQAHGIYLTQPAGSLNLVSTGDITTSGTFYSKGIMLYGVNAVIDADVSGSVKTSGTESAAVEVFSVNSSSGVNSNTLYFHDGVATVGEDSNAILMWNGADSASGAGLVHIGANSVVDATGGLSAVQNLMPEAATVQVDSGAVLLGGAGSGIEIASAHGNVINAGSVGALSDSAILNLRGGSLLPLTEDLTITNRSGGRITGYVTLLDGVNTFNNAGVWDIRSFADSDSDRVRDTLAVAVNDLGQSGSNQIVNSGTITLTGDSGLATALNSNGAYSTGYAANEMAIGQAAQGQILGVASFSNSGIIDLAGSSSSAGNVLLISGGQTAGVSGNGVFVANGGMLKVNAALDTSGDSSQSDMLVVDSARLGSSATAISVKNVGGSALTEGNGIELVRVLDSGASEENVFTLSNRLVSGVYEYDLYQGGVGADADNGNWYLRSMQSIRPEIGAYLGNMTTSSTMFMHTLHDRQNEQQLADKYSGNEPSSWVRIESSRTKSKAAGGELSQKTDMTLVHLGADLLSLSMNGDDRWLFGLMAAYGHSETDSGALKDWTNGGLHRTASGSVDGYSAGAYATWYSDVSAPTGAYVDVWSMYGWYDNEVQGSGQKKESYDSNGWTASIESGYAFNFAEDNHRLWIVQPQAQVAYNAYSQDSHKESNGTWVSGSDANGVITRLGARVYGHNKQDKGGIHPFIEANWWHSSADNSLKFDNVKVSDDTPHSRYEVKAGVQGAVAKGWQAWGHVGNTWGNDGYSRYEGMVGVKTSF